MNTFLLDETQRQRLAKVAGMFGSAFEGEVLNAARMLNAILRENGITLGDIMERLALLEGLTESRPRRSGPINNAPPPAWSPSSPDAIRARIDSLLCFDGLNDWERGFLISLRDRRKLSEGQRGKLAEIWEQHWGRAAA